MQKGYLISFEGIDNCGKTTQARRLLEYLKGNGFNAVLFREPGSLELNERIRDVLKSNIEREPLTETLLFIALRCEYVRKLIKPCVEKGMIVISDRYMDSTMAYQGYGKSVNLNLIERLNGIAVGKFIPDLTFILDVNPEEIISDKKDHFESLGVEFQKKVRDGYLKIAERNPERMKVIERGSIDSVFRKIEKEVDILLKINNR